ncbi:glycosyltransferase involved in cell wall biosynthesis [Algoriphagus aquaeductus]|uniref:Glycosyltransferase involved in cell wall biosynthesis n=1 Tax=Algoriphagus aquaeductus TaxID=475299 RepID=A0A326RL02_9BACT|nr:glycosyltransferase family 4 protein [Algoriphagus aquaeductus]PZV79125.1 glycosyltransferase involved in cell wall biosynthesis [Algoriphagus aquaeductus]
MVRILVSNIGLPNESIGSWTNRISKFFLNFPDFFDFILSPNGNFSEKNIYCKKKKWIPFFPKRWREKELIHYRASQFVRSFKEIYRSHSEISVLVMDDLLLLESFAILKGNSYSFELIFSFHGHSFHLPSTWGKHVDKVLFLTKSGYLETFRLNDEFCPMVSVVGNGVDSNLFFPISSFQKKQMKAELGFSQNSKYLVWMSNNRPKKGFHIFINLSKRLLKKYSDLEILVIGTSFDDFSMNNRMHSIGKIPNSELAKYLQISDFYAFTSLWQEGFGLSLVEAAKCGNIVIASNVGGIPDVIKGLPSAILVDLPNSLESWEKAFDFAWEKYIDFSPNPSELQLFHDYKSWELRYMAALV